MAPPIHGVLEVQTQSDHTTRIVLDPDSASITAGGNGEAGDIILKNANGDGAGTDVFHLDGDAALLRIGASGSGGHIEVRDGAGTVVFYLDGDAAELRIGASGNEGDIYVKDGAGRNVFQVDGSLAALRIGASGNAGDIYVRDSAGSNVFRVDGNAAALRIGASGSEGDTITMNGQTADLVLGGANQHGTVVLRHGTLGDTITMNGQNAQLVLGGSSHSGQVHILSGGERRIFLDAGGGNIFVGGNGYGGDIWLFSFSGDNTTVAQATIHLDGSSGDINLRNADCAEEFDVSESLEIEPGTVMVLDEEGDLQQSKKAYDRTVAGVVSGAGDYRPGILLDKKQSGNPRLPISLAGKVYCKVDAQYSAIKVGDLLTTSPTPGHAMKANDRSRAFGAVIGKALRPLPAGTGLIPVLIALQ